MCKLICFEGNQHVGQLLEIFSFTSPDDSDEIVKWCPICGAVVIDQEVDNRVYSGRIMQMRFPKWTKQNKRKK